VLASAIKHQVRYGRLLGFVASQNIGQMHRRALKVKNGRIKQKTRHFGAGFSFGRLGED
jgi:hypothetical protein